MANFLVVDDFESYNDDNNRIYDTWIDGLTNNNGSQVGYMTAPFAEQMIIHGRRQSMPFDYNNAKSLTGNGTIIARVDNIGNSDPWAKGGVMIRESLDAGSRFAIVFASSGNGVRFQARALTDNAATSDTPVATAEQIALQTPVWVKLERSGNTFNGYYSTDGVKWTAMSWNPQTINMVAPTVYIGLALTSHNATVPTTASFSGITTTGTVSAGPWQVAKIGAEHPGNDQANLYIAVEDSAGKIAAVANPDPAAVLTTTWTEWKTPLSSFAGVNLAKVKKLYLGVGDRKSPAADGIGRLYIDDIRVAKPQ